MIVRDEEETIAAALRSARDIVADVVVVDTGSVDDTVTIARQFTRQLYTFPWKDDFAAARNAALEKSRGDWVLWLDGDEELELLDADAWRESFRRKASSADALLVPMINYYGTRVRDTEAHLYSGFRLLRAGAGLRYKQAIHEHLDVKPGETRLDYDPVAGIRIRHYGYMDSFVERKQKHARNMELLAKLQQERDCDPWIDYHVAAEHYRQEDYAKAFHNIQRSIGRFLHKGVIPPALLYRLKYEILLLTGSLDNALPGLERAIVLYPDYVDLHYCKGLIEYRLGRFADSLLTFQRCAALGEDYRWLTLRGAGSFLAAYMQGMSLEGLGRGYEAMALYERIVKEYPDFALPKERLSALRAERRMR